MPTSFYVTNKNKARLGHNGIQDIMLSYILCLLGGIVIGAMAVFIIYILLSVINRKPSVASLVLMVLIGIVVAVVGTKICLAVNTLIEISDNEEKIENIANDTIDGISDFSHQLIGTDNEEVSKVLGKIKDISLGGSQYVMETMRKEAKRTIWRSLLLILGVEVVLGGICLALSENARPQRGYQRSHEHISRNNTRYHRRS